MEPVKRGKPSSVDTDVLTNVLLQNKDNVIKDGRIARAGDQIWEKIAKELDYKLKPTSVHSLTLSNRYSIRDKLFGRNFNHSVDSSLHVTLDDTTESVDKNVPKVHVFTLSFNKTEFSELITETSYVVKDKKKTRLRKYTILQKKKWTEVLSKKVYDETRTSHGFHFRNHYIYRDSFSGSCSGHCDCGSQLKCRIEALENERLVRVFCTMTEGNKKCGKRQLRNPTRAKVAAELQHKTVFAFRNGKASEMAKDDEALSHLCSEGVLRNVKYELRKAQYLNDDPKTALSILKRSTSVGQNVIRDIGYDPFFVHFWSSHQLRLYNVQVEKEGAYLTIDATGRVAPKLTHVDDRKSKHLFVYSSILQCDAGPFPVSRQVTESHDAVSIGYWLKKWLQSGAKFPNEVVCDESKALLNAIVWTFTPFLTIRQYTNACANEKKMPKCFIRTDCNHFMRGWSTILKVVRPRIKSFFLAAIGILVVCRNLDIARILFKAICIIASSETIGKGTPTLNAGEDLIKELTTREDPDLTMINSVIAQIEEPVEKNQGDSDDVEEEREESDPEDNRQDEDATDFWQRWKNSIDAEVTEVIKNEEGDQDNPRFCPEIAKRLLNQIEYFVLWGNAFRDSFGYGRVPATSAPIEGEFNLVKTYILDKKTMRVDLLVETLINQDKGRLAIYETRTNKNITADIPSEANPAEDILAKEATTFLEDRGITEEEVHNVEDTFINGISNDLTDDPVENNALCVESYSFLDLNNDGLFEKTDESEIGTVQRFEDIILVEETCPACVLQQFPTDTHKCILCKKNVHNLELCSSLIHKGQEEQRICTKCSQDSRRSERLALQEIENWKGEGSDVPKRSRTAMYLGKNKQAVNEAMRFDKHCKIPILKNGSNGLLKFVALQGGQVSVSNTCAFDSLFQIIFAAMTDNKSVEEYVTQEKENNELLRLVEDTFRKGLRATTYKIRAEILAAVMDIQLRKGEIKDINCEINIGNLWLKLFADTPSFIQTSECPAGCRREMKIVMPSVSDEMLLGDSFQDMAIETIIPKKVRPCPGCKGKNMENLRISKLGNIIAFERYERLAIPLNRLPLSISDPYNGDFYKMAGFIDYSGPDMQTRRSRGLEHYTAVSYRNRGKIIVYNDLLEKAEVMKKRMVRPTVLIYVKAV